MKTKTPAKVESPELRSQSLVISAALACLLGREKAAKQAKSALIPGEYAFAGAVTLAVDCEIQKLPAEDYIPTIKLPLKAVLGICLARAGFQRERIKELILEAAKEALSDGYKERIGDYLEVTDKALAEVEETLLQLPKDTRDGKTNVSGSAVLINWKAAAA